MKILTLIIALVAAKAAICAEAAFDKISLDANRLDVSYNKPDAVKKELLEPNLLPIIADYLQLDKKQVSKIKLAADNNSVIVQQAGAPYGVYIAADGVVRNYIEKRLTGHTQHFMHVILTETKCPVDINDRNIARLKSERPWLAKCHPPVSWQLPDPVRTYDLSEKFYYIDGDFAWVDEYGEQKRDKKEYDPKYLETIRAAGQQAEDTLENQKLPFGQNRVKRIWALQKELLKKQGIDWKSPDELNPGKTFFD